MISKNLKKIIKNKNERAWFFVAQYSRTAKNRRATKKRQKETRSISFLFFQAFLRGMISCDQLKKQTRNKNKKINNNTVYIAFN